VFCPVCKAEYREGFTKCSDCDVDLVKQLPDLEPGPAPTNSDAPELLWSGNDSLIASQLGESLEASNIRFENEEVDFGLLRQSGPTVYKVWVTPGDHSAAQAILDETLRFLKEREEAEDARKEADSSTAEEFGPDAAQEYVPPEFNPDEATTEVWAGSDSDLRDMLTACLGEVGIGCVVDEPNDKIIIRVEPHSESRAKEIVREVTEQTPPE
jgi:hypothetical protein